MRRRNITIRGESYLSTTHRFKQVKELLKEKFRDEASIDKFVEHVLKSGWDVPDIESFVTQSGNRHRPAVDAFLFNGEHVLDQVMLQQGVYTRFRDTAEDPNYAIRHKGQTELILRRLTPGDLLMLNATQLHNMSDVGRRPAEDQPDYWQHVWQEFVMSSFQRFDNVSWLIEDLPAAAVSSHTFARQACHRFEDDFQGNDLEFTFMNQESRFYTGVKVNYQTKRNSDGGFQRGWFIDHVESGNESLAMTALVLARYGIDAYARGLLDGRRRYEVGKNFLSPYRDYIWNYRKQPVYFLEQNDGNQETVQQREGEGRSNPPVYGRGSNEG